MTQMFGLILGDLTLKDIWMKMESLLNRTELFHFLLGHEIV